MKPPYDQPDTATRVVSTNPRLVTEAIPELASKLDVVEGGHPTVAAVGDDEGF